jgi:hypothetical protein
VRADQTTICPAVQPSIPVWCQPKQGTIKFSRNFSLSFTPGSIVDIRLSAIARSTCLNPERKVGTDESDKRQFRRSITKLGIMHTTLKVTCIILAIIGITSIGFCLGTLSTSDVIPLLKQDPDLYIALTNSFDFRDSAVASLIGNVGKAHLGGARVAPYEFHAKPKGTNGPWIFKITVEAETKYYDKSGKEVTLYDGEIIKEKLIGVRIVPIMPPK